MTSRLTSSDMLEDFAIRPHAGQSAGFPHAFNATLSLVLVASRVLPLVKPSKDSLQDAEIDGNAGHVDVDEALMVISIGAVRENLHLEDLRSAECCSKQPYCRQSTA